MVTIQETLGYSFNPDNKETFKVGDIVRFHEDDDFPKHIYFRGKTFVIKSVRPIEPDLQGLAGHTQWVELSGYDSFISGVWVYKNDD